MIVNSVFNQKNCKGNFQLLMEDNVMSEAESRFDDKIRLCIEEMSLSCGIAGNGRAGFQLVYFSFGDPSHRAAGRDEGEAGSNHFLSDFQSKSFKSKAVGQTDLFISLQGTEFNQFLKPGERARPTVINEPAAAPHSGKSMTFGIDFQALLFEPEAVCPVFPAALV